jgi:hypothetical protein
MPQSAVATRLVGHVVPVEQMPALLLEYNKHILKARPRIVTASAATSST